MSLRVNVLLLACERWINFCGPRPQRSQILDIMFMLRMNKFRYISDSKGVKNEDNLQV